MNLIQKLQKIIEVQNSRNDEKIAAFNSPITDEQIRHIEKLLDEPLPEDFKEIYYFADGQIEGKKGALFYESLMSSEAIINQLEFSRSLIKPENPKIEDESTANQFLKEIIDFLVSKIQKTNFFGMKKSWYKLEFSCGLNFYEGPYLSASEQTTPSERKILKVDTEAFKEILNIILQIHDLEKTTYNWDYLNFVIFPNGKFEVNRAFFDFDNQIRFTSTPSNAIKKKYFHYKWLPLFSDHGGNYIGIDLDPDVNGKKGQIIIFGRDEDDMLVISDDLSSFFDIILNEMMQSDSRLMNTESHLHDLLKEIKK